jgi:hypothetical protein
MNQPRQNKFANRELVAIALLFSASRALLDPAAIRAGGGRLAPPWQLPLHALRHPSAKPAQ